LRVTRRHDKQVGSATVRVQYQARLIDNLDGVIMKPTDLPRTRALAQSPWSGGVLTLLLAASLTSAPARAADASTPSAMSADASAMVVAGSLLSVAGAGSALVASVEVAGDGVNLVLDAGGRASAATVRVSGNTARALSVGAGTVLQVVAVSTGQMLVASGKVLAFVPNAVGQTLLHDAQVS
jgi:hypothetical protein